jgi:hypothetical protein
MKSGPRGAWCTSFGAEEILQSPLRVLVGEPADYVHGQRRALSEFVQLLLTRRHHAKPTLDDLLQQEPEIDIDELSVCGTNPLRRLKVGRRIFPMRAIAIPLIAVQARSLSPLPDGGSTTRPRTRETLRRRLTTGTAITVTATIKRRKVTPRMGLTLKA